MELTVQNVYGLLLRSKLLSIDEARNMYTLRQYRWHATVAVVAIWGLQIAAVAGSTTESDYTRQFAWLLYLAPLTVAQTPSALPTAAHRSTLSRPSGSACGGRLCLRTSKFHRIGATRPSSTRNSSNCRTPSPTSAGSASG